MGERRVYHRILDRARGIVKDNDRLRGLLVGVGEKLAKVGDGSDESRGFVGQLKLLVRMVRAHISGAYRAFAPMTLVMFAFALIYFITPIDLIPDFVPALGFTDDIAVALMIMRRFSGDIDEYKQWEELSQ